MYNKTKDNFKKIKINECNTIVPDYKLYEELLNIQSPSGKEEEMTKFIINYVKTNCPEAIILSDKKGNLYITKGSLEEGEYFPCLVAHTDEVHSKDVHRNVGRIGDFYIGWNSRTNDQEGIGADDKNGIFAALTLLDYFDKLKIFFPVEEEIGMRGTMEAELTWFGDVGYLLQCDRRGCSDLIIHTNGYDVTSIDFLLDIEDIMLQYNYKEAYGTATDIGELVGRGVGVSACNISCGYWHEHSDDEVCHVPSLENCINFVYHIIDSCGCKEYLHKVDPKKAYSYSASSYTNYSYHDDWYDNIEVYEDEEDRYKKYLAKVSKEADDHCPCLNCKDQDCMNCDIPF